MKVLTLIAVLFALIALVGCANSPDLGTLPTSAPDAADFPAASSQTAEPASAGGSYAEKVADEIGIHKDDNGHLLVEGNAQIKFLRLITYFNAEAKTRKAEGASSIYKVSGFYSAAPPAEGVYTDKARIRIQVSSDDFETPLDLADLAKRTNIGFSEGGYPAPRTGDPYEMLGSLLEYLNAEAANGGREHKVKAWYDRKEKDGELISDRVDIVVQFSFEDKIHAPTTDLALYTRNMSYGEERQKQILARIAVVFSRILESDEGLINILALDFSGDNEQGPEYVYVFEGEDIERLREMHYGKRKWNNLRTLSLAEVKTPAWSFFVGGALVGVPDLPESASAPRTKEPIGPEAQQVVAYIATELARVINPTELEIEIHEFRGNAPQNLTVWSYRFDSENIAALREEGADALGQLKKAAVIEQIAAIPGGREIPASKPLIK